MPARVVHVTQGEKQSAAIVECDHLDEEGELRRVSRWRVVMKQQLDFNSRPVGYRVWVQTDEMQPESEAEALAHACDMIEQFISLL